MKLIAFALISCFLAVSVTAATNPTCANHPIFSMAKSFLKRSASVHEEAAKIMEQFLDEFSNTTPKELTADELGVCSQYAGQQTCCSKSMTGFFDKIATLTGSVIQKSGNPISKFLLLMKKILVTDGCSTKIANMSAEDILNNPANPKAKAFFDSIQQSKLAFSKVVAAMNRGSLCSICVGVEEVNDFISSGKVYVQASSVEAQLIAFLDSWNFVTTIINNSDLRALIIKEIWEVYKSESCSAEYLNIFTYKVTVNFQPLPYSGSNEGSASGFKCSGLVLFNERPVCEKCQDQAAGIDEAIANYSGLGGRILDGVVEDVDDGISSEDSSISVSLYLPSEMDYKITQTGEAMISFSGYNTKSTASTFINRLQFGAILTLLSVFIF